MIWYDYCYLAASKLTATIVIPVRIQQLGAVGKTLPRLNSNTTQVFTVHNMAMY